MKSSDELDKLGTALAKAQGIMGNATINKVNPHFKSKYADLAAIREAVSSPLAQNGIAVVQLVGSDENGAFLTTRLVHSSGQWIESVHPLPQTAKPQEFGSALTYARRYSLAAICGISAEEDDDANAASEPMQTVRAPAPRTAAPRPTAGSDAKTPAEEWVGNQSKTIKTLGSVQAIDTWEKNNKGVIERLKAADITQANKLRDVLDECKARLAPSREAAE